MYPKHDLYNKYRKNNFFDHFSGGMPDVTLRATLENLNLAINVSEKWDSCLDIGGGSGHYAAALAQTFSEVTLVELTEHTEHTKLSEVHQNVNVEYVYIEEYKTDKTFDFILLADLFEHIPNIKSFISTISSLQTVGGAVYIMTPNPVHCGPASESGLYHTRHTHGHIKHYTQNEICALMATAGYELELALFEEAPARQKIKAFIYAVSRRDKKWSKHFIYRMIQPFVHVCVGPIFAFLDKRAHASEMLHRHNALTTITQDLVFKKRTAQASA